MMPAARKRTSQTPITVPILRQVMSPASDTKLVNEALAGAEGATLLAARIILKLHKVLKSWGDVRGSHPAPRIKTMQAIPLTKGNSPPQKVSYCLRLTSRLSCLLRHLVSFGYWLCLVTSPVYRWKRCLFFRYQGMCASVLN